MPHVDSKTRLWKTGLSLTVLTNVRARPRPRRLFVLSLVLPRILLTIVPLFDVFPRLQVTKARRRTTFSLVIIARLKGSPGYVYRATAKKEKEREKGIRANRFSGKLYDFKEHSRRGPLPLWYPRCLACLSSVLSFFLLEES